MKTIHISGVGVDEILSGKPLRAGCSREKLDALDGFFTLRKRLFIDKWHWDLKTINGREIDQYDHEGAHYVLVLEDDKVIAGARLLPTDIRKGGWSYMLRDACHGRLDQIPRSLIDFEPPVAHNIYEITRFAVDPSLGALRTIGAMSALTHCLEAKLLELGAQSALFLTRLCLLKWLGTQGIDYQILGPVYSTGGDQYCVAEIIRSKALAKARRGSMPVGNPHPRIRSVVGIGENEQKRHRRVVNAGPTH